MDKNIKKFSKNLPEHIRQLLESAELEDQSISTEWYTTRLIDFDLGYTSKNPAKCLQHTVSKLAEDIEKYEFQIGKRKQKRSLKDRKLLRQSVQALIVNFEHQRKLIYACDSLYLSVSLTKNDYGDRVGKEFEGISYTQFRAVYDAMLSDDLGCIKVHKDGYKDVDNRVGYRTSIYATDKFLHLIESAIGASTINFYAWKKDLKKNRIFIKNEDKKYTLYLANKVTRRYQLNIKKINLLLLKTNTHLNLPKDKLDEFREHLGDWASKDDYRTIYVDESKVMLHRVFNNNDLEQGGRFYGTWWQGIPSDFRRYITINGQETVELDYSEMHLTMLYAEEGVTPPKKPYEPIVGIERDFGKIAFNALLNTTEDKLPKSPKGYDKINSETGVTWNELLVAVIKQHNRISHRLMSGDGLKLQFLDSRIAEHVLLHFANKGIPCLPIHDSFIVTVDHAEELESVMVDTAKEIVDIPIEVKWKYLS